MAKQNGGAQQNNVKKGGYSNQNKQGWKQYGGQKGKKNGKSSGGKQSQPNNKQGNGKSSRGQKEPEKEVILNKRQQVQDNPPSGTSIPVTETAVTEEQVVDSGVEFFGDDGFGYDADLDRIGSEPSVADKLRVAMSPVDVEAFKRASEKKPRQSSGPVRLVSTPAGGQAAPAAKEEPVVPVHLGDNGMTLSVRVPCKTEYKEGERVDATGLVLFGNGRHFSGEIKDYEYSPIGKLTPKDTSIKFYAKGVTVSLPITVTPAPPKQEVVDDTVLPAFYPGTKGLRWNDEP